MLSKRNLSVIGLAISLSMFAAGCKKKAPPPPPPPPPAPEAKPAPPPKPPAPTVGQFSVEPTTIQRGQSATLRWEVSGDVSSVSIDNGIGAVQNTGNRRVFPSDSTTYTLTATGPGGSITSSATVTVTAPPPPPPPPAPSAPPVSIDQRIAGAGKVGEHKTSMLQDLEAGRPMELEAVVGAVVELGERLNIPMPHTRSVYSCTKLLDTIARRK
jgi:peptidoglycan-associated lipoprotein